ncbi:MAG: glycosyltransferase family 4 protein [Bacteroidetes bacterium]|nr:glycosyltransferase family 4 protein [Bacteroidota bacterium]
MKIALLTDGIYPYIIGGMQKHSYCLAKYLAKNQVEVELYHCVPNGLKLIDNLEGFSEDELKFINHKCLVFPSLGSLPGHYLKESWKYSEMIYQEIKPKLEQFDFIYAKGFTAWKLLDEKNKGLKMPPIGVNFHGFEMFQKPPSFKSRLEQLLLKKPVVWNCKNSDYVFSYGGKVSEIIKQKVGIPSEKIIEIPAGIEKKWLTAEVNEAGEKIKFVFVGRYERRKGIEEINQAILEIAGKKDFEFHFIGSIPASKKLRPKNIVYHGAIKDAEKLKQLIVTFDVLVCPSHSEGMPNVILEGMASGLAVIATDVGAVSALVDAENGWLINSGNKKELSVAMSEALTSSKSAINNRKKSSLIKIKERYLWDKIASLTIFELKKIKKPLIV